MFIVFEGVDCSGKTTQIKLLKQKILKQYPNKNVIVLREPGGTKVGEQIRDILFQNECDNITKLFLFSAARNELVKNVIAKQSENKDNIIICDRFVFSTIAYQLYPFEMDNKTSLDILSMSLRYCPKIDYVFYLDISVEEMQKRKRNEDRENNILDDLDVEFYQKVIQAYQFIVAQNKYQPVFGFDGTMDKNYLSKIIFNTIKKDL